MEKILNDLIICAGELGSIIWMNMTDEFIEMQVKAKFNGTIYELYVTKKEEKKDA